MNQNETRIKKFHFDTFNPKPMPSTTKETSSENQIEISIAEVCKDKINKKYCLTKI